MTPLTVAGLDRERCDQLARRLRALVRHAGVPTVVQVTTDALEVQRLGTLGTCAVIVGDRIVAREPLPGDVELEQLLVTRAAEAEASNPSANAV